MTAVVMVTVVMTAVVMVTVVVKAAIVAGCLALNLMIGDCSDRLQDFV